MPLVHVLDRAWPLRWRGSCFHSSRFGWRHVAKLARSWSAPTNWMASIAFVPLLSDQGKHADVEPSFANGHVQHFTSGCRLRGGSFSMVIWKYSHTLWGKRPILRRLDGLRLREQLRRFPQRTRLEEHHDDSTIHFALKSLPFHSQSKSFPKRNLFKSQCIKFVFNPVTAFLTR